MTFTPYTFPECTSCMVREFCGGLSKLWLNSPNFFWLEDLAERMVPWSRGSILPAYCTYCAKYSGSTYLIVYCMYTAAMVLVGDVLKIVCLNKYPNAIFVYHN